MECELKQQKFCDLLKKYKILFNKSQIPTIKAEKEHALLAFQKDLLERSGVEYTTVQLKKKLQNMKMEVKRKTDLKATGNKPIVLKECEKDLLQQMGHSSNPTFTKKPCASSIGFNEIETEEADIIENSFIESPPRNTKQNDEEPKSKKFKKSKNLPQETNETISLSTAELQRLVLLEQLKLTRLQIQKEEIKNVVIVGNIDL